MNRSSRKGFTLAEVLITLVVIGIVAALAIPSLLNNVAQSQFKTGIRKAMAALNEAIKTENAMSGYDANSDAISSDALLANLFAQNMSVLTDMSTPVATFDTADGMRFTFEKGGACPDPVGITQAQLTTATCNVIVDLNGPNKGPNSDSSVDATTSAPTYNDRFTLVITSHTVLPRPGSAAEAAITSAEVTPQNN